MSSQLDSLSFIKEGSTKRKEILAKFLDLDIFEKKFNLAKEDSSDLKGVLRRLGETDYKIDIAVAEVELDEATAELTSETKATDNLRQKLQESEEEYTTLTAKIDSIPAERLDIKKMVESRNTLEKKIQNSYTNISELKDENAGFQVQLAEYDEFLMGIDIEDLLTQKKEYDEFKQKYDDTVNRARVMDTEYKSMSKKLRLLDEVPCGDNYPTCRFISDAHLATVELPSLEMDIITEIEDAKTYKTKIASVDTVEMIELINRYNETIVKKNNVELEKRDNKVSIEVLYGKIKNLKTDLSATQEKIDLYEEKKELIQNIEKLLNSRDQVGATIGETKKAIEKGDETLNRSNRLLGSLEQKLADLREKKQEVLDIRAEYAAYDLFMRCMHSNGIAYDIIKKRLPVINAEIAKVLSNLVDFEVFFQEDGRKLNVLLKHPKHEERPIEMGSGAEKTIASMGIRLALLSISSLPKGNIFILDEPGTALDAENMEGFIRMLQLIKMYFKTVILISHLDSLKDIVDMEITIDKVKGFASVSQ